VAVSLKRAPRERFEREMAEHRVKRCGARGQSRRDGQEARRQATGSTGRRSADRVRLWRRNGQTLYLASEVSGRPLFGGQRDPILKYGPWVAGYLQMVTPNADPD